MNRADRRRNQKQSPKKAAANPALEYALHEGLRHQQAGDLRSAERHYRQVLSVEPAHPAALHLLGTIAHHLGHHEAALDLFSRALAGQPEYVEAHIFRGIVLRELQRLDEATASFERAAALAPAAFEAHLNLGNIHTEQGRHDRAAACYEKAADLRPEDVDVRLALGDALMELGRAEDAVAAFTAATVIAPGFARAHLNLGVALKRAGRAEEAIAAYHRALQIDPLSSAALLNLGNAQRDLARLEEAEASFRAAIAARPDFVEAHANLGWILGETGRFDEAFACYATAIDLNPDYLDAHNNLALLQLLTGDFARGWRNFEWRLVIEARQNAPLFRGPRWTGEALTGQRLAISAEQGIGDEIMFASLFPDLPHDAREIVIECDDRLLPLYRRSFPALSFIGRSVRQAQPASDPAADYQIPLGSLGMILRPAVDAFPRRGAYLRADAARSQALQNRYREWSGGRPVIGISWHSANSPLSAKKSTRLSDWLPILSNADYAFLSLQYGDVRAELEGFHAATGIRIFRDDDIDPFKDMDGFAAQIEALDAVVSISNATVHMAGALGKPVLLMLPFVPDWRWQLQRSDSLWYSSLRLFRQETLGDWRPVIQRAARELATAF